MKYYLCRFGYHSYFAKVLLCICRMSGVSLKFMEKKLKGEWDTFRGVTVSSIEEPRNKQEFQESLQDSISQWKEKGARAVWMKVYLEHSSWIPILVGEGFTYHHAKPNHVTMVKWVAEDEPNSIPCFAHNTIGVGGFVVNKAEELLVVRERFRKIPHWKLPGGYVEIGEDLPAAAMREVKEETGIDTEFDSVLAFRHMHGAIFGCSDLYFIVVLKPRSDIITMCKHELADCRWMKLVEYLEHPDVHATNKFFARCYLERKMQDIHIKATASKLQFHNISKDQIIYHMETKDPKNVWGYFYPNNSQKYGESKEISPKI